MESEITIFRLKMVVKSGLAFYFLIHSYFIKEKIQNSVTKITFPIGSKKSRPLITIIFRPQMVISDSMYEWLQYFVLMPKSIKITWWAPKIQNKPMVVIGIQHSQCCQKTFKVLSCQRNSELNTFLFVHLFVSSRLVGSISYFFHLK